MSSPASVAVAWMSSGLPVPCNCSASVHAVSTAPPSDGASTGQRSIATTRWVRAAAKSDFEHVVCATPRMEHCAAPAFAMCVDELADRRFKPGLPQRRDDQIALPRAIMRDVPMLHGAAAAYAEMRANRFDPLGAGNLDLEQMPPVGMTGDRFDFDRFARQSAGHIDCAGRIVGDAVAAVTEPRDGEPLNHALPR